MKTNTLLNLVLGVALLGGLTACIGQKDNPYANEAMPEVTMTTESSSFVQDKAEILFQLSHFIHKDVVLTLDVEGIERGAIDLPESFTIGAGMVKKKLAVNVDEDLTTIGKKDVVITVSAVENGNMASGKSSVTIPITVEDIAFVSLTSTEVDKEGKAQITFNLSKKLTKDAVLKLSTFDPKSSGKVALPAANFTCPESVTIPAGERTATVDVALSGAGLSEATYEVGVKIGSFGSNTVAGEVVEAVFSLDVGFNPVKNTSLNFKLYSGYWYVYANTVCSSFIIWVEDAAAGDLSDMDYVAAALKRANAFVKDDAAKAAYLAYWEANGYAGYSPTVIPQPIAAMYWGWPIMYTTKVVSAPDTINAFMVAFDSDGNLMPQYNAKVITQ